MTAVDHEGGRFVACTCQDGGEEADNRLCQEAAAYIEASEALEPDVRPDRLAMGHIMTPPKVIAAQEWAQMELFIPVKLKRGQKSCQD
ncbi:MAG: hypothetical protein HDT18_10185 [Oscillibacter sp.]|nr:hypothetical protein [Oscillibacter sp.]